MPTTGYEYTKQAEDFLTAHNLTFRAVYVGEDCPMFCEDARKGDLLTPGTFPRKNHIHGSHWRLTIAGEGRGHLTIDYWDSYKDAETRALGTPDYRNGHTSFKFAVKGKKTIGKSPTPSAYDMLSVIEKNEPGTFEDWCGDMGMDTDSRRALSIWESCVKQYREVRRFFTAEELAEVQEIN